MDRTNVHSSAIDTPQPASSSALLMRLFKDSAAFSVNVNATICSGKTLLSVCMMYTTRRGSTSVFPEPAHAISLQMMLYLMHGFILRISQMNFTPSYSTSFLQIMACTSLCRGHPALPRGQNARADTLDCCLPYQTRGKYLPQRPANQQNALLIRSGRCIAPHGRAILPDCPAHPWIQAHHFQQIQRTRQYQIHIVLRPEGLLHQRRSLLLLIFGRLRCPHGRTMDWN